MVIVWNPAGIYERERDGRSVSVLYCGRRPSKLAKTHLPAS